MSTYAEEKKAKDAAKAKRSQKFEYRPVLFDMISLTGLVPGDIVVKVQPHNAPRNGTMGMTYVGDPVTGEFIGMVCVNSLKKVVR